MFNKKNRRNRKPLIGLMIFFFLTIISGFYAMADVPDEPPEYLKSVTYFSDAWVINFWNTESDNMEEELEQIASDGFNSIILVVPWREFQPGVSPISYNNYAFEKLEKVMNIAEEKGLWVKLRVSYTWDYYADDSVLVRFRNLVNDDNVRKAWIDYIETVYKAASAHKNFCGGFITWEDFWNYVGDVDFGNENQRIDEASKNGYQEYLREYYTLEKINEYYTEDDPFETYEQIYIPRKSSPAYKLFYEFYDDFLIGLLQDGQQVFPDLSMEVRLDVDPVNGLNDTKEGVHHFRTFPCAASSYTALMYSVSMGQENKGEKITAEQAMAAADKELNNVKAYNGGKPLFIDQLLYMDATEEFSYNAQLEESEKPTFIALLPELLNKYTNGYGLWTYKNYTNNPVYNSQFVLGEAGWKLMNAKVVERDGTHWLKLDNGGKASPVKSIRINGQTTHDNHVRFMVDSNEPVTLKVKLGSVSKQFTVNGKKQIDLNFGKLSFNLIEFSSQGTVYIDNVDVYNFIQDGQLHDIDGQDLSCIQAFRELNALIR